VDHGVEPAEAVDLLGDGAHVADHRQIAGDRRQRLGDRRSSLHYALFTPLRVENTISETPTVAGCSRSFRATTPLLQTRMI
jgi:hypothetical protein